MKEPTSEQVDYQYRAQLKREIEKEDGVGICIDCKTWNDNDDVIQLCPKHNAGLAALEILEDFVRSFSKNGEFNSRTADFTPAGLRSMAADLLKESRRKPKAVRS